MPIKLGNITIAELYLGSQKISEAYLGSTLIYNSVKKPYFVFEFSEDNFVPTTNLLNSTLMSTNLRSVVVWNVTANNPTWTDVKNGLYLFTEASVSKYAGVSMNRSRLYNKINSFNNATTVDEYYYPAFIQIPDIPGSSTTYQPTWIVTTESYNGMLPAGQGNTDMPGTLDYGTYGTFTREYGTYDSTQTVRFAFLVTNTPIASWAGLSGEMAFLYDANYNTDAKLRWFFE